MAVPHKKELMMPVLGALSRSGGSGTFEETLSAVSKRLGLTESDLQQTFPRSGSKMVNKRMGHVLEDLKTAGWVDYTRDGWTWSLTEAGRAAWTESERGPEAAQEVAARLRAEITGLRAEARKVKRERNKAQKAKKAGKPAGRRFLRAGVLSRSGGGQGGG